MIYVRVKQIDMLIFVFYNLFNEDTKGHNFYMESTLHSSLQPLVH